LSVSYLAVNVAKTGATIPIGRADELQLSVAVGAALFAEIVGTLPTSQELPKSDLHLIAEAGLGGDHLSEPGVG
jgi:hypothetical protein